MTLRKPLSKNWPTPTLDLGSRLKKFVERYRKVRDPLACGVVDGVRNCRRDGGDSDLPYTVRAEWRVRFRNIGVHDVDMRNIGLHGDVIFGQRGVHNADDVRFSCF